VEVHAENTGRLFVPSDR